MFRLALALGMTVEELGVRMSAKELAEWIGFDRLSPIGDERGDLRAGIVASTIANCHRGRGTQPFRASDFMPFAEQQKESPESALQHIRAKLKG